MRGRVSHYREKTAQNLLWDSAIMDEWFGFKHSAKTDTDSVRTHADAVE